MSYNLGGTYSKRLRIEIGNDGRGITLPYGVVKSLRLLRSKLEPAGFRMSGINPYQNEKGKTLRAPSFGTKAVFIGIGFDIKVREINSSDPKWDSDSDKALSKFIDQVVSTSSLLK